MQKTKYEGIYKQKEGVLLNLDNEALKQYKAKKQKAKEMNEMKSDVEELKSSVKRIEELLLKVLAK